MYFNLLLKFHTLLSSKPEFWSYWKISDYWTLYLHASRKYHFHSTWVITSSMPTILVSIELWVFIICFVYFEYIKPLPIEILVTICPFMSWFTGNDPRTHHLITCSSSSSKVNTRYWIPLMYFTTLASFLWLSQPGDFDHSSICVWPIPLEKKICIHVIK